jgi:hypothetical protein
MVANYDVKRWLSEPNFCDTKDLRFGVGIGATRIGEATRRTALLIDAFAIGLLTCSVRRAGQQPRLVL